MMMMKMKVNLFIAICTQIQSTDDFRMNSCIQMAARNTKPFVVHVGFFFLKRVKHVME